VAQRVVQRSLRRVASAPPKALQRVLIAHHLLLGDTLMLTPLIAKLRHNHPAAEIVMSTPKAIAPLYANRPYGLKAVPYEPTDLDTARMLAQSSPYDLALVPGDNRFCWLAYALDARWIVAFEGDRPGYKSWPADELRAYRDRPATWGDMAADLVAGDPPAPYDPAQWRAPPARPFDLPDSRYAVLHVGASTPLKLWPAKRWLAVAEHLTGRGFEVVWSGGPQQRDIVHEVDPRGRFRSYAGALDLAQLWRLLAQARLLVAPDTGIAHLGRIVGTPTIALFGPGSSSLYGAGEFWRNSPYWALAVDPFPCRDQHALFKRELAWVQRCARSRAECADNRCMQAIAVDRVLVTIEQALCVDREPERAPVARGVQPLGIMP
jgi:ADP-heptose:LPS heptosyltransferase